jgi:hypothetical protein
VKVKQVTMLEVGGPPSGATPEQIDEWIARRVGRPVAEVRERRRAGRERRGGASSNPEWVRDQVAVALDDPSLVPVVAARVANKTAPKASTNRHRVRPKPPSSRTTTPPATDPHRARAATYGGDL